MCAGLQAGIEGAIHTVADLFEVNQSLPSGWGVLLIDATYALNSLNRIAMLIIICKLWPRCSRFVFNAYCGWPVLVLCGHSGFLYSEEGVTQGDPLSMFVYAVALIQTISDTSKWTQMWYADDASAGGLLTDLYDLVFSSLLS